MNIKELWWIIEYKIGDIKHYFEIKKYKKLYPDFIKEDEYDSGYLKHIWGVKSWDDLTGKDACLYTMNDIDIIYCRESKLYMLGVETAYMFNDENRKHAECKYLKQLLKAFTKFMNDNNYSKDFDKCLFISNSSLSISAESIEELYMNFKIFVEGYCKVYGYESI
jgi:hypothetical protein